MAIKLADTARPNNHVDAEHLGTFPVAYAEDVWFSDGTRLSEKTFDGDSIQKEELPIASADELGNIYQYVGETGTYTKGYFYECVSDGGDPVTYFWKELISGGDSIQKTTLPVASEEELGNVYQYIGTTGVYNKGSFYECVENDNVFSWKELNTDEITDVSTLPVSNIKNVFYRKPNDEIVIDVTDAITSKNFDDLVSQFENAGFAEVGREIRDFSLFIYYSLPYKIEVYNSYTSQWFEPYNSNEYQIRVDNLVGGNVDVAVRLQQIGLYVISADSENKHFVYRKKSKCYYAGNEEEQITERIPVFDDIQQSFIGTKAQWEQLSTAEKKTYSIVNFTDDDGGENLDYYSTAETKTNKVWINGKPVYRKCWSGLDVSTNETNIGTIDNVDIIVNIEASISQYTSTSGTTLSHKKPYVRSQADIIVQNNNVRCKSGSGFDRINVVAIEYTKTTD